MKVMAIKGSNDYTPLFASSLHLNNRKKKRQLVCLLLAALLLAVYILFSYDSVQNYRNQVFDSSTFWTDSIKSTIATANKSTDNQCISQSSIEQTDYTALEDFNAFIDVLNQQSALNYFMCFSTLFYATKVHNYNPYRSVYNTSDFDRLNTFYKSKYRNMCVNVKYDLHKITQVFNLRSLQKTYR